VTAIAAARVVTPGAVIGPAVVETDGGLIASIVPSTGPVEVETLVPGFVDLQVNGIDYIDVSTASGTEWTQLDQLLLQQGVTTWCPTLISAPLDSYAAVLARLESAAARDGLRPTIAGVHLEGPFLSTPGAHRPDLLAPIDLDWLGRLPSLVRLVTLAPELDGVVDAIHQLAGRGVLVALGHTHAGRDDVDAATTAGARLVTHLFNAMSGLHHRDLGVAGAALADDRLACSLIADLVHVDAGALKIAFRALGPDRAVLVTDAVAWRGSSVGPLQVHMASGAPRLADGTLAGSALTMDQAIRNVVNRCDVSLADAVAAGSTVPAHLLGLDDRGAIAEGLRADLVALDDAGAVSGVWLAGERMR
jgi:N-acetylglucosamine-6-phosphate deacetylase